VLVLVQVSVHTKVRRGTSKVRINFIKLFFFFFFFFFFFTFLCHKLVGFVKIGDKFVIGRADRKLFASVNLPANEQVQLPAKERVIKTNKATKLQGKLEAVGSEVTSFVKDLYVDLHTKCSAVELSAKLAEQQIQLQAALEAKVEAEAALASARIWYKDQLAKVQAEWSATNSCNRMDHTYRLGDNQKSSSACVIFRYWIRILDRSAIK
jgi:hypothetical protein